MSAIAAAPRKPALVYPESDGLPMAESTLQFRWIVTIQGGLDGIFRGDPNVFVAGDLLWYPVEGNNTIRVAPDALVAQFVAYCAVPRRNNTIRVAPDALVVFGRRKGDRGSYLQWLEEDIAPQVTFEVLSPGNRAGKLVEKFKFYERYGVDEYYVWDPDTGDLSGWLRADGELTPIADMNGWVSPRLKVRFELAAGDLRLYGPDGTRFATYLELVKQRDQLLAQHEQERQAKDQAHQRADRLAAQLKALGIEPEA